MWIPIEGCRAPSASSFRSSELERLLKLGKTNAADVLLKPLLTPSTTLLRTTRWCGSMQIFEVSGLGIAQEAAGVVDSR